MNYEEFLRRIPKVELHCHVEGSVRPETLFELARKHRVALDTDNPRALYSYETFEEFFTVALLICSTLVDRDDFARIAYESVEDAVQSGNLKYREMFFTPTLHTRRGVAYATVVDGLIDGVREAESRFGARCRLIADICRQDSQPTALAMVEEVLRHRRPEVVGLGLDSAEPPDPPEKFVVAYRLAAAGGLHLTAHACEDAPAKNVTTCLDLLRCQGIDHGYHILGDPEVVERARRDGVYFTVCPTATARSYFSDDLSEHPIRTMVEQGLRVTLGSDDPPMFATDLGSEYVHMCTAADWDVAQVREICLNGVDAAWLDDGERQAMRSAFVRELDVLEAELEL